MAISIYNAEVIFKDDVGIKAKTTINKIPVASAPDLSKLLTLATALKSISNAGVFSYSLLGWEQAPFAGSATPAGLNTVKAVLNLSYPIGGITQYRQITIPNPAQTLIESVVGQGTRVTAAKLATISGLLSTSSGIAVTATEGKIAIDMKRSNSSPTGTAIAFRDENGNDAYMHLPKELVTTFAALTTLTTALQTATVSASKIVRTFMLTKTEALPDPTSGIGLAEFDATNIIFSSVEERMRTSHCYTDTDDLRAYMHVIIPAPIFTNLEDSGKYWKFSDAVGIQLAEDLSTFLGATKEVTFAGSKLNHKNLRPQ